MNELQSSLFEAMQAFRDNAIQNSKGTITLECIVTRVKDAGLGEYYVKYLENDFIAYANANVTYSVGDNVYVLVPEGDFTKNKVILGMTNPRTGMYVSDSSNASTHFRVSDNFVTEFNDIIKMSSYEDTREDNLDIFYSDNESCLQFAHMINNYAETGHRTFELSFLAKTFLATEQQNGGNYGVAIKLPLIANSPTGNGNTEVIWKTYTLDVGNMLGNPYRFEEWSPQSVYFTIDDQYKLYADADKHPMLSYFCYDFQHDATKTEIKDVWIKNIGLYVSDPLSAEDTNGYFLKIKASEGNYFTENTSSSKTLSLVLKVNGKETSLDDAEIYWFIEDASIRLASNPYYCNYGSLGWRCLNQKTNVVMNPDGTSSWDWINNVPTYEISLDEYDAAVNIKCAVVYDGQVISDIITLRNLNSEVGLKLYSSTGTTVFLKDTGYVYLTADWSGWRDEESLVAHANNTKFNWLRYDMNGKAILDDENFFEIVKYNEVKGTHLIQEVRFPVNAIDILNRIVCSAMEPEYPDDYEGTASITITTTTDLNYNLIINNDDIIYKYDSNGDSPAGAAYDGPPTSKVTSIAPLTYTIRKADGQELSKEEYCYVKYKWIVPKDSFFRVQNFTSEDDDNYYFEGYDNLNHNINLPYDIIDRFNLTKVHKSILLIAEYQGNNLSTAAQISFIKEGQSGSNGTQFTAMLLYGGDSPDTSVPYANVGNNGLIKKLKVAYEITSGKLFAYVDDTFVLFTNAQKIFTKAWRDGEELQYHADFEVEYSMFDPKVCNPFLTIDDVNPYSGVSFMKNPDYNPAYDTVNILQAKVTISTGNGSVSNSEEIIYAYYPIEFIFTPYMTYIIPSLDGGFAEVMYSSDGTSPEWDETTPFRIRSNGYLGENLNDYYDIVWNSQYHLDIEEISEDGLEAKIKPHNKYDDGNSCNYVGVQLTFDPSTLPGINDRINDLELEILTAQEEKARAGRNRQILTFFANSYIPGNWMDDVNLIKPFLEAKYSYYNSLVVLGDFIQDFYNFLDNRTEDFTDLRDSLNILAHQKDVLIEVLSEMYLTPGTNYEDLFELFGNKIPWSDEIKEEYLEEYGLSLTLQLEQLIENINNQIRNCDRLENIFVNLRYEEDDGEPIELTDEDLANLTDEDLMNLAADPGKYKKYLMDEDKTPLTDEDDAPLLTDFRNMGGYLTDEDHTPLLDEDDLVLLDDATIGVDYMMLFKSLYRRISQIFNIDTSDLYEYFANSFDEANRYITYVFKLGSYIDIKNVFEDVYDSYLKGSFNYNRGLDKLILSDVIEIRLAGIQNDAQTTIDNANNEIFNLRSLENINNISILYTRPIVLYFNRYEMSNINAWDGNKIDTGDGTYLLAPQVGAGVKEEDNSFTGIVMGQRNLTNVARSIDDTQVGIFGYHKGVMSLFLNARNGAAIFGESGTGGQIIIDPASRRGMIYSSNFWSNYDDKTLLPTGYDSWNETGYGLLIDLSNGLIRSRKHDTLHSATAGFFLGDNGVSIGSKFFVDAETGALKIGQGAVAGEQSENVHHWDVDTRADTVDGVTTYESYIAFGGNKRYDADNPTPDYAKVYIGTDGFSIGENFTVDKDGNLKIGGGSIGGDSIGGWWIYDDHLTSNNYKESGGYEGIRLDSREDYISLGRSNAKIYSGDHDTFDSEYDGFYLGYDGFSIGDAFSVDTNGNIQVGENFSVDTNGNIQVGENFSVDANGNATFSGILTGNGGNIGGWEIESGFLRSPNWDIVLNSTGNIWLTDDGKICSGTHSTFDSLDNGFYLSDDGLSIGSYFAVNDYFLRIGDYEITTDTGEDPEGRYALQHSMHSWKLRSFPVNDEGTRYYTYLTKNRNFIVSTAETSGHSEENDVTDNCQLGSKSYPWKRGYYKSIKLLTAVEAGKKHYCNVIPDGVIITVPVNAWQRDEDFNDIYSQRMTINGITRPRYEATHNKGQQLSLVPVRGHAKKTYKYEIEVYASNNNEIIFFANTLPDQDLQYHLLVEEYKDSDIDPAELWGHFDDDENMLYLSWNSPADSSTFITWQSDQVIIEKQTGVDEHGEPLWEEVYRSDPITIKDKYIDVDAPLAIGP